MLECTTNFGTKKLIPKDKFIFRPSVYSLVINEAKILLMRCKSNNKLWFPGGGVEIGESLEYALAREIKEETGLNLQTCKFFHFRESYFYYEPADFAMHALNFFYITELKNLNISPELQVNDIECEKPNWYDLNLIKNDQMNDWGADIIELIKKEL